MNSDIKFIVKHIGKKLIVFDRIPCIVSRVIFYFGTMVYVLLLLLIPLSMINGHGLYVPGSACVHMLPSGHKDSGKTA